MKRFKTHQRLTSHGNGQHSAILVTNTEARFTSQRSKTHSFLISKSSAFCTDGKFLFATFKFLDLDSRGGGRGFILVELTMCTVVLFVTDADSSCIRSVDLGLTFTSGASLALRGGLSTHEEPLANGFRGASGNYHFDQIRFFDKLTKSDEDLLRS
ncbi:hypothetical protein Ciccas_004697 [Cichlidogyrus casuarinus]|uniref:Uncharacterized protein n=1 Tax=Cichlidogyrus casuarinus TaxID=1844966 RepID=A0ABD2QAT5_9PLAT